MNPYSEIDLRPLPQSWANALAEVQTKSRSLSPIVIAGGAMRDLYLRDPSRIKDLDIFVLEAVHSEFRRLIKAYGRPDSKSEYPGWMGGVNERWSNVRIEGQNVDLIVTSEFRCVNELLRSFDLNLAKAAHDGSHAIIHEDFIRGVADAEIKVVNDRWRTNTIKRLAKYQRMFPDYSVNRSLLEPTPSDYLDLRPAGEVF